MKESGPSGDLESTGTHSTIEAQNSFLSRFQLALLDDFHGERRGYDPYDTFKGKLGDVWSTKRKRG
jgi:hypothetical protein